MAVPGPQRHEPWADGDLRRAVLAVSVLEDVDLEPRTPGVLVPGRRSVLLTWPELRGALAGSEPSTAAGVRRLSTFLRLHRAVADLSERAAPVLADSARLLALPADHVDNPGAPWRREDVLGGALQLGVGVLGLLGDAVEVVPLHPLVAQAAGADPGEWWRRLRDHAEAMGSLAAHRLARDAGAGRHSVLRPVGGCDVPTLLASRALRGYLAEEDGSGLRALAVPMRSRGWYDLARIDPAFVGAAWSATSEPERGFPRPLLVTAEEVTLTAGGGNPVAAALADPAAPTPALRDVRYR